MSKTSFVRYSGELSIRMTFLPDSNEYRCFIRLMSKPGSHARNMKATIHVPIKTLNLDMTANAALSFAHDDGWPIDSYADLTEDCKAYVIRTRK